MKANKGGQAQKTADKDEWGQVKVNEGGWAQKMVDEDKWGQALTNEGQQHQQGVGTVTMGMHERDRWVPLLL